MLNLSIKQVSHNDLLVYTLLRGIDVGRFIILDNEKAIGNDQLTTIHDSLNEAKLNQLTLTNIH